MRLALSITIVVLLLATVASAGEHVLPVYALNIPGQGNSLWTSEVYVTNLSGEKVVVHEGSLIPGAKADGIPCLPVVQPFLDVPPFSTVYWPTGSLALGIGCPDWARGALTFWTVGDVLITSRMVNIRPPGTPEDTLLRGFGQEIAAVRIEDLQTQTGDLLLPSIVWHPNACEGVAFDTNLFFTNPGDAPVVVELSLSRADEHRLVIGGVEVDSPFRFVVSGRTHISFRAAPSDPQIAVCLDPEVGAFAIAADGPLAVVGSVVDRSTQDARTVLPVRVER